MDCCVWGDPAPCHLARLLPVGSATPVLLARGEAFLVHPCCTCDLTNICPFCFISLAGPGVVRRPGRDEHWHHVVRHQAGAGCWGATSRIMLAWLPVLLAWPTTQGRRPRPGHQVGVGCLGAASYACMAAHGAPPTTPVQTVPDQMVSCAP